MQVRALFVVERRQEVVLDLLRKGSQPPERLLPVRRDANDVTTAVVGIATALDQPSLLELIQ